MWRELIPVVLALRNPDLKDRHWARINHTLGVVLERDDNLTLDTLVQLQVSEVTHTQTHTHSAVPLLRAVSPPSCTPT